MFNKKFRIVTKDTSVYYVDQRKFGIWCREGGGCELFTPFVFKNIKAAK